MDDRDAARCHPHRSNTPGTGDYELHRLSWRWRDPQRGDDSARPHDAASIWITAAIGILVGIGFYFAAVVGTLATLAVLAVFRWIEQMLPAEFYAHHMLRFDRENVIAEADVRGLLHKHGF